MNRFSFRLGSWRGNWPAFIALPAGAVLLWVGFALALALAMLAGLALLPSWLRSLWPRREVPRGPTTIEGSYTKHVE